MYSNCMDSAIAGAAWARLAPICYTEVSRSDFTMENNVFCSRGAFGARAVRLALAWCVWRWFECVWRWFGAFGVGLVRLALTWCVWRWS